MLTFSRATVTTAKGIQYLILARIKAKTINHAMAKLEKLIHSKMGNLLNQYELTTCTEEYFNKGMFCTLKREYGQWEYTLYTSNSHLTDENFKAYNMATRQMESI